MSSLDEHLQVLTDASSDVRALRRSAEALGRAQDGRAEAPLVALWHEHASVRAAAGRALLALATPLAFDTLEAAIDGEDALATDLGICAVFRRDPETAFDRLARFFEEPRLQRRGEEVVAFSVLLRFCPDHSTVLAGEVQPQWRPPDARDWLTADARWVGLCVQLCEHPTLGAVARDALSFVDPQRLVAAEVRTPHPPAVATGDLLARYQSGEYEAVWASLRRTSRLDDAGYDEALAVCRAAMRRFAEAAEQLEARLEQQGWSTRRHAPAPADASAMEVMQRASGARLPPCLRAFWEVVGGLDWSWDGTEPVADFGLDLYPPLLDPLVVLPARTAALPEPPSVALLREPLFVPLGPGRLHKARLGEDEPRGVQLPFAGVDPWMLDADGLPLSEHLRVALYWAGFPGLSELAIQADVRSFVRRMTQDLPPF